MLRTKTCARITKSCLIGIALMLPLLSIAETFNLGKITQAEGEITFLDFGPPTALKQVSPKEAVQTNGSYLTKDDAFMTVEFFDGSWLRVSPKSKLTIEYQAQPKTILIHLFLGSAKILFSNQLNQNKIQKIVVKSADTVFDTVDAKFSVVRNPLTDTNSVFVEKGTVIVTQHVLNEKKDMELVHSNETVSVKDNQLDIESPNKMSEREIKFLHNSQYLKQTQKSP